MKVVTFRRHLDQSGQRVPLIYITFLLWPKIFSLNVMLGEKLRGQPPNCCHRTDEWSPEHWSASAAWPEPQTIVFCLRNSEEKLKTDGAKRLRGVTRPNCQLRAKPQFIVELCCWTSWTSRCQFENEANTWRRFSFLFQFLCLQSVIYIRFLRPAGLISLFWKVL